MQDTVLTLECYDLRKVEIYFTSSDAASRVLSRLRSQPFSPERFLQMQLQKIISEAAVAGACSALNIHSHVCAC